MQLLPHRSDVKMSETFRRKRLTEYLTRKRGCSSRMEVEKMDNKTKGGGPFSPSA
jgi:hypothetical protein